MQRYELRHIDSEWIDIVVDGNRQEAFSALASRSVFALAVLQIEISGPTPPLSIECHICFAALAFASIMKRIDTVECQANIPREGRCRVSIGEHQDGGRKPAKGGALVFVEPQCRSRAQP